MAGRPRNIVATDVANGGVTPTPRRRRRARRSAAGLGIRSGAATGMGSATNVTTGQRGGAFHVTGSGNWGYLTPDQAGQFAQLCTLAKLNITS